MKRKVVVFVLLLVSVIFLGLAVKEELPYIQAQHKNGEIRNLYSDIPDDSKDLSDAEEVEGYENREIDFTALQTINPDIIGWIYVPDTPIDYPILQNPYDNYYLSHDAEGSYSEIGSVFMQAAGSRSFTAEHNILYAHNLIDDQMFGALPVYANQGVRDSQPYIYVYLPNRTLQCEIYSAYECADGSETYRITYADSGDFAEWINMTVSASNYTSITPKQTDKILTLSTCADMGSTRFVVHSIINEME